MDKSYQPKQHMNEVTLDSDKSNLEQYYQKTNKTINRINNLLELVKKRRFQSKRQRNIKYSKKQCRKSD